LQTLAQKSVVDADTGPEQQHARFAAAAELNSLLKLLNGCKKMIRQKSHSSFSFDTNRDFTGA